MRYFGLAPDQVLAREPAPDSRRIPSLPYSILYGALSFSVVAVLAYLPWVIWRDLPEPALYTLIAAIFVGLIGPAFKRLVIGSPVGPRLSLLLGLSFLIYAAVWCAFWFGLRRKLPLPDLWGSVIGLAAVTFLIGRAFEKRNGYLSMFIGLLVLYSVGYYLGGYLHSIVRGPTGRILYGLGHGLGFGAGLGFVLFHAQSAVKLRLQGSHPPLTATRAGR